MDPILLYTLLFGGGTLQVLCFLILCYLSQQSKKWANTKGRILSSEIVSFGSNDEDSSKSYKVAIKYQYQIDNQIYISRRLRYGDWIGTNFSSYTKKLLNRYREGSECIVYYNPQKPQKSVLETTLSLPVYLVLVSGLLFLLIGLVLLIR